MSAHAHPRPLFHGHDFSVRDALRAGRILMREAMCGLGGHDYLQKSAANRVFLRCTTCGHETPGWKIDGVERRARL